MLHIIVILLIITNNKKTGQWYSFITETNKNDLFINFWKPKYITYMYNIGMYSVYTYINETGDLSIIWYVSITFIGLN